jgi:hypothetical protein
LQIIKCDDEKLKTFIPRYRSSFLPMLFVVVTIISYVLNGPAVYACEYSQGTDDIVTVGVSIEGTDPSTASAANGAQVTTNDGAGCTITGYFATQAGYNRSFLSTEGAWYTGDIPSGEVGTYDETYVTYNSCDPTNTPGIAEFTTTGNCADASHELEHLKDTLHLLQEFFGITFFLPMLNTLFR